MIRRQGCGDEGETKEGNLGRTWRWVSMGQRGDPGKIHRSRGFGVRECWKREGGQGWRGESENK